MHWLSCQDQKPLEELSNHSRYARHISFDGNTWKMLGRAVGDYNYWARYTDLYQFAAGEGFQWANNPQNHTIPIPDESRFLEMCQIPEGEKLRFKDILEDYLGDIAHIALRADMHPNAALQQWPFPQGGKLLVHYGEAQIGGDIPKDCNSLEFIFLKGSGDHAYYWRMHLR